MSRAGSDEAGVAEVLHRVIDAWNDRDLDTLMALLDPDVQWHDREEFPDAGVHRGREAVRRLMEGYLDALDEIRWEVQDYEVSGSQILARSRLRMKGRSSGIATETDVYVVGTVRDGLLTRRLSFSSREAALEALEDD